MSRNAFDRANVDENGEREEVRFVDPDIEEAYQNEGVGMNREAFQEYLEVKKTIRPLNIVKRTSTNKAHFENHGVMNSSSAEANGAYPAASTVGINRTSDDDFAPSRRTTMRKWGRPGEDIPEGTPDQVREAMVSLECWVRKSEREFSGSRARDYRQGLLPIDHEAEARRLLASPSSSPQLLDQVDQIPFVPVARSRVSQLRRSIDRSNLFADAAVLEENASLTEGHTKYRTEDFKGIRAASDSSIPSNYAVSGRQNSRSTSRFAPRTASSSGLTADEFMAVVHRGPSRSNSRRKVIPPPSGATFRGRQYSQETQFSSATSPIATDQNTIDLASSSTQTVDPLDSVRTAPKALGHSISTTRRHGIRFRSSGTPSDQRITVAKGRRGPSRQEAQADIPAAPVTHSHDLSFLPQNILNPGTETLAKTVERMERAMLAYFIHAGVNFIDDAEVRQARSDFQRIWDDCRLGSTTFKMPGPSGEITHWI
ncbi:hypothetical protein TWF718_003486 [Orbilia javanica]|uniref:Uncharacterized protein n=1 Tax=Orbilia javanica TaxID=47235 RepID=A0AAN8R7Y4_9PEZI